MARAALVPLTDAQRDEAARPEHVKLCEYAADRFARRYPHVGRDPFLSAALGGLMDAARNFDPSRSMSLGCLAPARINGACLELLRRQRGGVVYLPRRVAKEGTPRIVSLDAPEPATGRPWADLIPDIGPVSPGAPSGDAGDDRRMGRLIRELLAGLPPVRRLVVEMHYGIGGDGVARTFVEIARLRGCSRHAIRQSHGAAIETLREAYRRRQGPNVERREAG